MSPLVSIVIPTYNRVDDLERSLNSVLMQTYDNWEVLLVDNHSDDGTDELVKRINDPRIHFFKIHNNGVIAASRNLGIQQAKGDFVAFLDSDDWWKPRKLEISMRYLVQGADLVYHDLYVVTKTRQRIFWSKARTRQLYEPVFNDLIVNGWAINNSSVVVRRKLLNEINGLSEEQDLVAIEDFDAWLRISRLTEKFVRIPYTLGYYWLGGGNTSSPERTLKTLTAIDERYKQAIDERGLSDSIYWSYYAKGRANYILGNYEIAKQFIRVVLSKKLPIYIFLKCHLIRFQIFAKIRMQQVIRNK